MRTTVGLFYGVIKIKGVKPFLTFDEQIEHLMEQGLLIEDREYAKNVLSEVNYYRLINAYGLGLYRDHTKSEFKENTTFTQIYSLYMFDTVLRHIMTELLETFEIMFRTRIAHYLGENYGSLGYLLPDTFVNNEYHQEFINNFEREKEVQKKSPIVKHHKDEYGGKLPVWAAVEILSFGSVSKLYKNMKPSDKNDIARQYGTASVYMDSWLRSFVEVRNICAHYGRLYNMPLTSPPRLYKENKNLKANRIFAVLYTLKRFTPEEQWASLMLRLKAAVIRYPVVNMSFIGFPQNWEEMLDIHALHC